MGFVVSDCPKQRNLSAQGRADARKIEDEFSAQDFDNRSDSESVVPFRRHRGLGIRSSQTIENVRFHVQRYDQALSKEIREVKSYTASRADAGNLVFVTHASNIQALIGFSVATGKIIVTKFKGVKFKVMARFNPLAG
ncbi:MAG: hypothetical protein H7315_10475 [Herminiimonas sp.]|nr:hypothetical protein [Herminiimonas sp.]